MLSALRRLAKKGDDSKVNFPSGVAVMNQSMQKKFARGIQYNMKILLKGDRNTGKSCLLTRLQGGGFREEYIPTQEIQVACINWNYRGGDEVVKVEVWDVVDKANRKRRKSGTLKVSHDEEVESDTDEDGVALDAEFVDVYKGTHGVIMLMDITKTWTWTYIERELPKIPHHIPVLVMANFRDMGDHRLIDEDRMLAFIEHLERPPGSAEINYTESCLKNGFGLRYIYRFLNMPFLILQRETLLRQLEANALEIEDTRETLQLDRENEDQNYDMFMEMLEQKKNTKIRSPKTEQGATSPVITNGHGNADAKPSQQSLSSQSSVESTPTNSKPLTPDHSSISETPGVPVATKGVTKTKKQKEVTNFNLKLAGGTTNIDDFHLTDELDPSFLDESAPKAEKVTEDVKQDSSSDDESMDGNPLVEDYQDLESEDESPTFANSTVESPASPEEDTEPQTQTEVEQMVTNASDADDNDTESSVQPISPVTSTENEQPVNDPSSSEDESTPYVVTGNIDIESGSDEAENVPDSKQDDDSGKIKQKSELDSEIISDELGLQLAGLDDFMAEQLGKASLQEPNIEKPKTKNVEKSKTNEDDEEKEVKKKKKKTKKEKTPEEGEKVKKKKKKSKDPGKRKKKSEETENADYELL